MNLNCERTFTYAFSCPAPYGAAVNIPGRDWHVRDLFICTETCLDYHSVHILHAMLHDYREPLN